MELAKTYRIETERLLIRCYEPADAQLMHSAITGSLEHLRPWIPWARQEPQELEWMENFIRLFRGQFDLGQDAATVTRWGQDALRGAKSCQNHRT